MQRLMGDWLRRLLYPLVLPAIVGTVWVLGWVRQQEDRTARGRWTIPPLVLDAPPTLPDAMIEPPSARVVPRRSQFVASVEVDEAADEP